MCNDEILKKILESKNKDDVIIKLYNIAKKLEDRMFEIKSVWSGKPDKDYVEVQQIASQAIMDKFEIWTEASDQ